MARRRSFSAKDRARIFAAHNGVCHICIGPIKVGEAWEVEHVIPWALTRDDSDGNLRPAHKKCHREEKTGKDVADIAQAKRREAIHTGAVRPAGRIASPLKPAKPIRDRLPMPPRQSLYRTQP